MAQSNRLISEHWYSVHAGKKALLLLFIMALPPSLPPPLPPSLPPSLPLSHIDRTGSKLGISPLMLAAMNGHTAAVKLLLDMGSDINAQVHVHKETSYNFVYVHMYAPCMCMYRHFFSYFLSMLIYHQLHVHTANSYHQLLK